MKKKIVTVLCFVLALTLLCTGCGSEKALEDMSAADISKKAVTNHTIKSVGMPDGWMNWKDIWAYVESTGEISHTDEDMGSMEELTAFASGAKGEDAIDIGDVGRVYAIDAEQNGLTQKYKTSYWDDVPDWAKDDDGDWIMAYYGTMAFLINTDVTGGEVTSFEELANGNYPVVIGDVMTSNQARYAVLAASKAFGGTDTNIQPGLEFFEGLAESGRLVESETPVYELSKHGAGVAIVWDFNALNYRDAIVDGHQDFNCAVHIPSDGAIQEGYSTIINANANNPEGAALVREYLLSDEGQTAIAKGYASPIREIELPEEIKSKLLPESQYENVFQMHGMNTLRQTLDSLSSKWNYMVETILE